MAEQTDTGAEEAGKSGEHGESLLTVLLALGANLAIAVVVVILVGFFWWRRRKR